MKKQFICLANSKKYTQRCVAGIELVKSTRRRYKYDIVRTKDDPVWLRPVSPSSEHGEISAYLVDHIKLLDIVEVNGASAQPQGFQRENVLFDGRRLAVIDNIDRHAALLDKLVAVDLDVLFGNTDKAVGVEAAASLDRSLALIKPTEVDMYQTTTSAGTPQVRGNFVYNGVAYDFPVTDIGFSARFRVDPALLAGCQHIYFTVSLGVDFEDWHYKLIAGVVYF